MTCSLQSCNGQNGNFNATRCTIPLSRIYMLRFDPLWLIPKYRASDSFFPVFPANVHAIKFQRALDENRLNWEKRGWGNKRNSSGRFDREYWIIVEMKIPFGRLRCLRSIVSQSSSDVHALFVDELYYRMSFERNQQLPFLEFFYSVFPKINR